MERVFQTIAHIYTDFPSKFGIPRQSGLADTIGKIVFEPEYRSREAVRGLEMYSHVWLLWEFSETVMETFHPTVRPPRLGGNQRIGVFATRSPFRPNPIGLSCVRLDHIDFCEEGPVIYVVGADIMDGTPIYDIKPYLPYVDSHSEATGGFAEQRKTYALEVDIPEKWLIKVPEEKRAVLRSVLAQDPRPSYQEDEERIYGMTFAGLEVRFRVVQKQLCVVEICEA